MIWLIKCIYTYRVPIFYFENIEYIFDLLAWLANRSYLISWYLDQKIQPVWLLVFLLIWLIKCTYKYRVPIFYFENIIRWVAGTIASSTKRLMFRVLFFFIISCKLLCKNPFNLFFYNFTKKNVLSAISASRQPTVLFSIFQNNTWTIRRLVDEAIDPATQRIILKIVGFNMTTVVEYHISIYKIRKIFA